MQTAMQVISFLSTLFVFVVGVGVLTLFAMCINHKGLSADRSKLPPLSPDVELTREG